mmetsp:Transcript_2161/g.5078  ORF Transcript_2161/g.5078 Transcript_2161/m.5078 type:complete len:156 (+) Transcript_2161:2-469(+)
MNQGLPGLLSMTTMDSMEMRKRNKNRSNDRPHPQSKQQRTKLQKSEPQHNTQQRRIRLKQMNHQRQNNNTQRKTHKPPVSTRYGKWVGLLKNEPELRKWLHDVGSKGLKAFGYEPMAQFMDCRPTDEEFQCNASLVCPDDELDRNSKRRQKKRFG